MCDNQLPAFSLAEVRDRFEEGVQAFLDNHADLFKAQIGENAMSSELKNYLEKTFAPWDANSQYDAFGIEAKKSPIPSRYLRPTKRKNHPRGHLVTPDIIVHKRLGPLVNLLAIEAKKEHDARGIVEDREKLRSYQGRPLLYPYVAMLVYGTGQQPICRYELFDASENPQIPKQAVTLTARQY